MKKNKKQTPAAPLIVIASNRGPFSFKAEANGEFSYTRGSGGLVTALSALAKHEDVLWVSAALSEDDRAWANQHHHQAQTIEGIDMAMLVPDLDKYEKYYNTISNPLLWFIQHQLWDITYQPLITQETWDAWENGYVTINQQFAETITALVADSDRPVLIFPQDYHLYLVAHYLREQLDDKVVIQPFLHIPWPGPDAWRMLSAEMREPLLRGMLAADRIGFQTEKDAFNFVQTCRFYLPDAHSYGSRDTLTYRERKVETKAYPISIDVTAVEQLAASTEAQLFKAQVASTVGGRAMVLRVDRIEPSKNILRGLQAYRSLLEMYPEHHGRVMMLALLVPSRMDVPEYSNYLQGVMAYAGLINADFSDGLWEPVRVIVGDNYTRAIAAMQQYDVLLVNPLADGMNLVAKEGALVNERSGVLLLSEHAGAMYELGEHALTIMPFDIYQSAQAIHQALTMPMEERVKRAQALRKIVREADVTQWFRHQVDDAMRTWHNHANSDSTPPTPATKTSAAS